VQAAEAALATPELGDRGGERGGVEVRPHGLDEQQLGLSRFPSRKSDNRCSPPVRTSKSTSGRSCPVRIASRLE
jgi:hypothetical protein